MHHIAIILENADQCHIIQNTIILSHIKRVKQRNNLCSRA